MDAGVETNALNLKWTFGFNSTIPNSVHSLVSTERSAIFYVAAHTGVILDVTTDKQLLLQGHCHEITATCVSADKRFIVTADAGADSMLVVWDSVSGAPLATIMNPFPSGTCSVDLSKDNRYLVAISQNYPGQELSIFEWQVSDVPIVHTVMDGSNTSSRYPHSVQLSGAMANSEYMHFVAFNAANPQDLVTNGLSQVIFWLWGNQSIVPLLPSKGANGSAKRVGVFTRTVFIPGGTKAAVATSKGFLLVLDYPMKSATLESALGTPLDADVLAESKYEMRDAGRAHAALALGAQGLPVPVLGGRDCIKTLSLCNSPINVLSIVSERYLVCACGDGAVRFYDAQFRVAAWYEHLNQGALISASFALDQDSYNAHSNGIDAEFSVPELIVATAQGVVLRISSRLLDVVNNPEGGQAVILARGFDGDVDALDVHPSLPVFAVGTSTGHLQLWDLDDKELLASRLFTTTANLTDHTLGGASSNNQDSNSNGGAAVKQSGITCVKFAPNGKIICIGFSDGSIELTTTLATALSIPAGSTQEDQSKVWGNGVVDPLQGFQSFHIHRDSIQSIAFSPNEQYFAVTDANHCVSLFKYTHAGEQHDKPLEWVYLGSNIAHYEEIVSLHFEPGHVDLTCTPARLKQQYQQDVVKLQRFFQKCPPRHLKLFRDVQAQPAVAITRNPLLATFANNANNASNLSMATKVALLAAAVAAPRVPFKPSPYRAPHPRLLSVGKDSRIVEYDVAHASIKSGLKVSHVVLSDRENHPTASCMYNGAVAPASEFLAAYKRDKYQDLAISSVEDMNILRANQKDTLSPVIIGTGNAAGRLSVGPNIGGTYPPLPLLMQKEADDLHVQAEALLVANSNSKFTIWHSQPAPQLLPTQVDADGHKVINKPQYDPAFWWRSISSHEPSAHDPKEHIVGVNCTSYYSNNNGNAVTMELGAHASTEVQTKTTEAKSTPTSALACLISSELVASASAAQVLAPVSAPPSIYQPLIARKTLLAPTHDTAITSLVPLPLRVERAGLSEYLVYSCAEQLIGLTKLPLTGSPNDMIAIVAHPGHIRQVACTSDGRYVVSIGGKDRSVNVWSVNTVALDVMTDRLNAQAVEKARGYHYPVDFSVPSARILTSANRALQQKPTAQTLKNNNIGVIRNIPALAAVALTVLFTGRDSALRKELLDHFCHCQLRWQGLYITQSRTMNGMIAVSECVTLLRAMGCYLSETEVRRLHHQLLWDRFTSQGCLGNEDSTLVIPAANAECIRLEEAVQQLMNFRPLDGKDHIDLEKSLQQMLEYANDTSDTTTQAEEDDEDTAVNMNVLTRETFVKLMGSYGEPMSNQELNVAQRALMTADTNPALKADNSTRYVSHNFFGSKQRRRAEPQAVQQRGSAMEDYVGKLFPVIDARSLRSDILQLSDVHAANALALSGYTGEVE